MNSDSQVSFDRKFESKNGKKCVIFNRNWLKRFNKFTHKIYGMSQKRLVSWTVKIYIYLLNFLYRSLHAKGFRGILQSFITKKIILRYLLHVQPILTLLWNQLDSFSLDFHLLLKSKCIHNSVCYLYALNTTTKNKHQNIDNIIEPLALIATGEVR